MVDSVRAWHPAVPHVREVLHATFREHAYPAHTHDAWTLLIIDEGAVRYDLDRAAHIAEPSTLSILPPHVPHDGRSATPGRSFRKRVLYLDADWLPASVAGAVAERPEAGADAAAAVRAIHRALANAGEELAAESALAVMRERLLERLGGTAVEATRDDPLARRLRALLDERLTENVTLAEAARLLHAHPSHLVRSFSRAFGIPPHRYVTGRRVDLARTLLATGMPSAQVAVTAGFHDQAHLTRHFRRVLGATPTAFAA